MLSKLWISNFKNYSTRWTFWGNRFGAMIPEQTFFSPKQNYLYFKTMMHAAKTWKINKMLIWKATGKSKIIGVVVWTGMPSINSYIWMLDPIDWYCDGFVVIGVALEELCLRGGRLWGLTCTQAMLSMAHSLSSCY